MMAATIGLAIKGGAAGALPVAIVGLFTLLKPLTAKYRRFLIVFTASVVLCFLGGAAFSYYVLLPAAMGFLLSFGEGIAVPVIDIGEYLGLLAAIVFWMGVIFTLPPAMYVLTKFRLIEYKSFRKPMVRKLLGPAAVIFSAIITPSLDPWLTLMMAVPIVALYEVGVFASWVARPEEGNYLWLKTVAAALRRLRDALAWPYRRVRRVTEKQIVIVVTVLCVAVWVWLLAWLLWDDLLELLPWSPIIPS